MKLFFATVSFLTRIPVPFQKEILPEEDFAKGIFFYPLVGLFVGFFCALIYFLFHFLGSSLVCGAAAVLTEIVVTGAFHLDGLADTFDAFYSSRTKERMLEIMRDSRVGTNGAAAIVFDILLKTALLSALEVKAAMCAVLLTPVAGKMITPVLMRSNYAREGQGLGNIYLREKYNRYMIGASLLGAGMIGIGFQIYGMILVFFCFFWAFLFRWYCNHKIGGMTGDTLGAGCELTEIVFLILILVIERRII